MEKRKPKGAVAVDELALVKSAAWAWYQRGSGSEGQVVREFDAWKAKIEPKPTRYKLEALRNSQGKISKSPSLISSSRSSTANSLLDTYEIERISRMLNYYIDSGHAEFLHRKSSGAVAERKNKSVRTKRVTAFWSRHVLVCGSSTHDVVDSQRFDYSRREKGRVTVAEVVGCRPRPWPWGVRA